MFALETRAPAEVFAPRRAHHDLKERRLLEFRREIRGPVKALARRHRYLADLAVSFPALLFALAHPRRGFDPEPAMRAVVAGEPLSHVACLAGVPLWLRHVAPSMFARALPVLPDSAEMRRTIVNHLPRKAKHAGVWFETVSAAARDGTEEFALWCARHLSYGKENDLTARLRLLALWSWYSAQGDTIVHALIEHAFHPSVTLKGAILRAEAWKVDVQLHLDLAHATVDEAWHARATVDGFDFVPLSTESAMREEAQAMQNCLKTYGYGVATGTTRLWSVRKDGARVATLSVKRSRDLPLVYISDVKAAANKAAPEDALLAAHRWFCTHALPGAEPQNAQFSRASLSRTSWNALWKPYWLAKRRIPEWLPLRPSRGVIAKL